MSKENKKVSFLVKKTNELKDGEIKEVNDLFNKTFKNQLIKPRSMSEFIEKFSRNFLKFSFHGLMICENKIIGCYHVIPYEFKYFSNKQLFGQSVDTTIDINFRGNIFNLKKLAYSVYDELKKLVKDLVAKHAYHLPTELEKHYKIINEIFMYQDLRMPRVNMKQLKLDFKYNIAEYMFFCETNKKANLVKQKNMIQTENVKNYENNYWEFTKKKIIWARKDNKIKNEIDYDNRMFEKIAKMEKNKLANKEETKSEYKVNMFNKLNKFKKYDSLVKPD